MACVNYRKESCTSDLPVVINTTLYLLSVFYYLYEDLPSGITRILTVDRLNEGFTVGGKTGRLILRNKGETGL